jgi:recombinational DNA repair protein (RecF pathway)
MSYRSYITDIIVCGARPHQSSDRSYLLFTRVAGMIYATAKSVREERSKQRYALQEFSYGRATLIHGRSGWKVAGVEAYGNLFTAATTRGERALVRGLVSLVRRTMQGEEAHPEVFDDVRDCLKTGPAALAADRERILSLRVLHRLGYVAAVPAVMELVTPPSLPPMLVGLTDETRRIVDEAVAHALSESHL